MQRLLIGIEDAEDVDGVSGFIDDKGDQDGEPLPGFAANVFIANGKGGQQFGDPVKILATRSAKW